MARRTLSLRSAIRERDQRAGGAAGPSGDPDFASVVLLLDFAGIQDATNITDLSDSAHVETFTGTAKVDLVEQYFGMNSVLFAAGGAHIEYADHADWAFPGDFTIEFAMRWTSVLGTDGLIANNPFTSGWWTMGSPTHMSMNNSNSNVLNVAHTMVADTWYHVAYSRTGSAFRCFVGGVQIGSTVTYSAGITKGGGILLLGDAQDAFNPFGGRLAAVRITKGVGRYSANFDPPTVFYPTSA